MTGNIVMNTNPITPLTEYAGFWRRSVALLVDTLWIGGLMIGLLYLFEMSGELGALFTPEDVSLDWTAMLINDIPPAIIIITLWYHYATTPGKWLIDCEIVDATTGMSPTLVQSITRYFAYIISILPLGLGFLWILWDKRRQGWHDKFAHTVVIVHDEATVSLEKLLQDSP
jgi:uncharacterized RDD family membrane protein YckC